MAEAYRMVRFLSVRRMMTEQESSYGAQDIQILEGLEHVRKRPGMYIGSTGPKGLHHLVYEVVDNSVDEALAGFCSQIDVTLNKDGSCTVVDDGRGIPVEEHPKRKNMSTLEVVLTILNAGGKFGGSGYKVSGGLHGVGVSVVNALSSKVVAQVKRDGAIWEMEFSRGKTVQKIIEVGKTEKTGTTITFWPDPEIFQTVEFDYETLRIHFRQTAFLNKGLKIVFCDDRGEEPQTEVFQYKGGIIDFVGYMNEGKAIINEKPVYFEAESEAGEVEISMQWTETYSENVRSFANNIDTTDGGTHLEGFRTALTKTINEYARKKNLLKEKDENLSGEDCREGLTAVISVKLENPQFEGQTKSKLGNSDIRTMVDSVVSDKLEQFFEENPAVAKQILEKGISASRAREAARKARDSVRRKTGLESGQMPDKLQDCNERDPSLCEIYIVEGDSAAGSAIQGRDSRFQAILAMWGKMLNVEKARVDKIYGNDKLYPLIVALGAGIGNEFNIDKLRYHKIVIMADVDVDGSHIRTLLLTFFFRYMRPLIENGYVYSAVPPLFKLSRGKQQRVAYSDEERDAISRELRGDNPDAKVDISRFKGLGEMDPHELWETTMDPERRTLRRITLEDAQRADEIFTVLMGDEVEPRRAWIETKARYVVNLDY